MKRIVSRGDVVMVKPNIGWNRSVEQAACTHPEVLRAVIELAFAAGAKKVVVMDNTCHKAEDCYARSGIEAMARQAGAELRFSDEARLVLHDFKGEVLGQWPVFRDHLEVDKFINVPVLKHHGGAKLSLTMKNLMGVVWDRRFFHDRGLDQCIADLCFAPRVPDLSVLDAYRILRRNGPQGRAEEDGEIAKYQLLGRDMVALDAAAAKLFGHQPEEIGHIRIAGEMGAGRADLGKVRIKRLTLPA
jgi:uncharacterized protein (DUF362 family)